jgi:hypothetical protein
MNANNELILWEKACAARCSLMFSNACARIFPIKQSFLIRVHSRLFAVEHT